MIISDQFFLFSPNFAEHVIGKQTYYLKIDKPPTCEKGCHSNAQTLIVWYKQQDVFF